ncbi:MAG: PQQ-binding-like beta-propeller repeat protein [Verrucomicrobiales bacterium]
MKSISLLAASLCLLASAARADWPQFMGSDRSGVSAESVALADSFPGGDPKRVWMVEVGAGLAGPAVSRGKVIVFHRVGDDAVAAALDAATGKAQWEFRYPTDYQDSFGFDPGPRAVPTIGESEVVLWGAEGMVHCLEFETGKLRWKVDAVAEFGSEQGFFGRACPPLIAGGLVIAEVGGPDATVVAFDRQTGAVKWKALRGEAGYAAPVLAKVGGKPTAIFFTRAGFAGVDPASGEVLWDVPFRAQMHASVNAAAPATCPATARFSPPATRWAARFGR